MFWVLRDDGERLVLHSLFDERFHESVLHNMPKVAKHCAAATDDLEPVWESRFFAFSHE